MAATTILVMGCIVGAGELVLHLGAREDSVREAEGVVGRLTATSSGFWAQPLGAVERGVATPSELWINGQIGDSQRQDIASLEGIWPSRLTAAIKRDSARAERLSARTLKLVAAGRVGTARRLHAGRLKPTADELAGELARAERVLEADAARAQREALAGTLAITGAIGILLVAVVLAVSAARRRRGRAEAREDAVRQSEERLQALVRHGSDMITVVDPDTTILYEAGAVRSVLGYEPSELEGKKLTDWIHPDDTEALISLCASANGGQAGRELRLRHRDGGTRICEVRATSLLGHRAWEGIVLNVWDVSERKALEERLRHQAFHDDLTGLANRALLGDRLGHALTRARRTGSSVSVLLVDLDDFKSINDSLGHAAGDRLLREVAERLTETMRAADTIARFGGDEFAIVLDESEAGDDEQAAQRILEALAEPFEIGGRKFPVTASVGIARSAPGAEGPQRLIRNADLAMYTAKGDGKSRWSVYRSEMHIATKKRLRLKADLAHALEAGDELELHYQPMVALDSGEIVGLEALLRWQHPVRGTVQPSVFIPMAEETGAIVPIGRWVLREACRRARAWTEADGRGPLMSVNVSARQLNDSELIPDVRQALEDSGLPPERLVLELTETELMRDMPRATRILEELRRLGVRIAIDDFGTGYSSLSQLQDLPVDVLKVDRTFIEAADDRAGHAELLQAVVDIGDSLQLSTIAEGIETEEQLAQLRGLRFRLGQGFLFSRPVPAAEIDRILAARRAPEAPKRDHAHRLDPRALLPSPDLRGPRPAPNPD